MLNTLDSQDPARHSRMSLHLSRASSKLRGIRLEADTQMPSAAPDIVIGSAQREEGVPAEILQAAKDFYESSEAASPERLGVDVRSEEAERAIEELLGPEEPVERSSRFWLRRS
jgi:hypothetical protein